MNQDSSSHELDPRALDLPAFDLHLTRALEDAPEVSIPTDFAARVASQVPARRTVSLRPTHYGDYALLLGVLVALAALFVPLSHAPGGYAFGLVESLLLAQFIVLTIWLSLRRQRLR
jgi:hypothetical protein